MKRRAPAIASLLFAFVALPAFDGHREEGAPAPALGLGDSVRSAATGMMSLYFNPAGMSQAMNYVAEGGYTRVRDTSQNALTVGAVDSRSNEMLAMGVGYTYLMDGDLPGTPSGKRSGHIVRLGASAGVRGDELGLFVGGTAHWRKIGLSTQDDPFKAWNFDLGLMMAWQGILRFGAVARNLASPSDAVARREMPRGVGGGMSVFYQSLLVAGDVEFDLDTRSEPRPVWSSGAEYFFAGTIPIRVGYQRNETTERQYVTFGIGAVVKTISVDASYALDLGEAERGRFAMGVRFYGL